MAFHYMTYYELNKNRGNLFKEILKKPHPVQTPKYSKLGLVDVTNQHAVSNFHQWLYSALVFFFRKVQTEMVSNISKGCATSESSKS